MIRKELVKTIDRPADPLDCRREWVLTTLEASRTCALHRIPKPLRTTSPPGRPTDLHPTGTPDPKAPAASPVAPADAFAHKPPKPIGPEALKALREAIKSGKYPSDDAVRSGLERLIRRPE